MPFDDQDPSVLGKRVLVGVTWVDGTGREVRRGQWWGKIIAFNRAQGLLVDLKDSGTLHAFPPFPDGLRPAKPGTYELQSTAECIADVDFLYTFRGETGAS